MKMLQILAAVLTSLFIASAVCSITGCDDTSTAHFFDD